MTRLGRRELLARLVSEFERRGWRDDGETALSIVRMIERTPRPADVDDAASVVSGAFLERNDSTRRQVRDAIQSVFEGVEIVRGHPLLISMESIDSFSRAADVLPGAVADIANPLDLPEASVKLGIAEIIGEPYLEKDWGGELSDILTARVVHIGRRVSAAFVLKGRGTRGPLTPRKLGKNADQIRRMSKQEAEVYVVQHVGPIDAATRDQLADMIAARRYAGARVAVGSIWDGVDVARLFVAHHLLDPSSGAAMGILAAS